MSWQSVDTAKVTADKPQIVASMAVMLILVLVLKDSLRTKFKSLSLSLHVQSLLTLLSIVHLRHVFGAATFTETTLPAERRTFWSTSHEQNDSSLQSDDVCQQTARDHVIALCTRTTHEK